jgi:LPXTG-motif cell wall-anchored protein
MCRLVRDGIVKSGGLGGKGVGVDMRAVIGRSGIARGLGAVGAGVLLWAMAPVPAAEAAGPAFVGYCTPDGAAPEDSTCTLDEPEGKNPDTYGTVVVDRTISGAVDTLSLDLPAGTNATEVQICLTLVSAAPANPYVPTSANSCAGNDPDRAYQSNSPADPVVVDVAAFFAGDTNYTAGDPVWFTAHVNSQGRTLYVTGGSSTQQQPATRTLVVTKELSPSGPGTFAFTVDCQQTSLSAANTSSSGVTFDNGNASFSLGHNEAVGFTGIADDDTCTVTEADPGAAWTTTANGSPGRSAVVSLDGQNGTAAFVNTQVVHSLTVSKDVVSSTQSETFTFTVDCGSYALSAANTADAGVTFTSGDASFALGDNDSVVFAGVPHGTVCAIAETAPATAGGTWSTTVNGTADDDRATSATLDQDRTAAYVNTFTEVAGTVTERSSTTPVVEVLGVQVERELPRTGASVQALLAAGLTLLALGAVLVLTGRLGRRRRTA